MEVRHPEVVVPLVGQDGNVHILGLVRREMQRAEVPAEEVKEFFAEATAGGLRPPAPDGDAVGTVE